MTTATPARPITARAFLFGDTDLISALQTSGAAETVRQELQGFAQTTRDEAVRELGKISAELLDQLDLTQLVLGAWSTHAALRAAGQRTVAAPQSEELVDLARHRVTLDQQPSIDLLVNGTPVATVHFGLSLVIDIAALTATVRAGRLIGLRVGRCNVDAGVSIESKSVASRQAELPLHLSLRLGSGIALVANAPPVASPGVSPVREIRLVP